MSITKKETQRVSLLYQLLLLVTAPLVAIHTAIQAIRGGGLRYLLNRLGLGLGKLPKNALWIHAASVGEVVTVAPLVRELQRRGIQRPMLLSTTTPTGAQTAQRLLADAATHLYLPLDWPPCVNRTISRLNPQLLCIVETELWPNLYTHTRRRHIPLVLINARLSPRSLTQGSRWAHAYRQTLAQVTKIFARSETDAAQFLKLGAASEHVHTLGNLKYAGSTAPCDRPAPLSRPYILAASTHDGEEVALAALWKNHPAWPLLVIAPRHPKRAGGILQELADQGLETASRSREEQPAGTTNIYLADTLGELPEFFAAAELVIMGGTFVPVGGHNILEPARESAPILFGPHMHNFAVECDDFLAAGAALQVVDYPDLECRIQELLDNPELRNSLGKSASALVSQRAGIEQRYADALLEWLDSPASR